MLLRAASSSLKRPPASLPATESSDAARNCTHLQTQPQSSRKDPSTALLIAIDVTHLPRPPQNFASQLPGCRARANICSAFHNRRPETRDITSQDGAHSVGGLLASGEAVPDLLGGEHILVAGCARLPGLRRVCSVWIEPDKAAAAAASPDL